MGDRNLTLVLCESRQHSQLLNHLSISHNITFKMHMPALRKSCHYQKIRFICSSSLASLGCLEHSVNVHSIFFPGGRSVNGYSELVGMKSRVRLHPGVN